MTENLLRNLHFDIGKPEPTVFQNAIDIYQDGTVPFALDEHGRWWALSGHTHKGHIGLFRGTCVDDMQELYTIHTNFETGAAGSAFATVKYPEGVRPVGLSGPSDSMWFLAADASFATFTTRQVGTATAQAISSGAKAMANPTSATSA